MIAALIRWSARNVFLVGLATIIVTLAGIADAVLVAEVEEHGGRTPRFGK